MQRDGMKLINRTGLPTTLRERLVHDVQRHRGSTSPPHLHRVWVQDYPYSRIFRLHFVDTGGSFLVYLKGLPRWVSGMDAEVRAEKLRKEYATLQRVSAAPLLTEPSTPDPIGYYPDYNALAMSALPGKPLRHLLAEHMSAWNPRLLLDLKEPVRHVGSWLRELHTLADDDTDTFEADSLLEFCEAQVIRISNQRIPWLPPDYLTKFERVAQEIISKQPEIQLATTFCHGDYKSHNIWIADGRIQVLDFGNSGTDIPMVDVCSFWVELECSKWEHLNSARELGQLQDAFLDGCSVDHQNNPLFELVAARYFLLRLANGSDTFPQVRRRKALEARVLWHCRKRLLDLLQRYA